MQITPEERKTGTLDAARQTQALRAFRDTCLMVLKELLDSARIAQVREVYDQALFWKRYWGAI